jgi:hypothetical protein
VGSAAWTVGVSFVSRRFTLDLLTCSLEIFAAPCFELRSIIASNLHGLLRSSNCWQSHPIVSACRYDLIATDHYTPSIYIT